MKKFYLGQIKDDNNVLAIFVGRIDGDSIGFYDSNGNLIAEWNPPVPLEAAEKYSDRAPSFLTQIDSLWQDILKSGTSIEKRTSELEAIANELGLDIEKIMSFSSFDMSQEVATRKKHNEPVAPDKDEEENSDFQNPNLVTDSVHARSEIALNKLVDDRYTLGDILGVDDPNATLICVDSIDIKGPEKSNSQFSFLIKHSDGTLEKATMFSQDDGTSPDRDVYSSNRDGSSVDKVAVRSMYRINSPLGKNCMISTSYDSYGMVNLQLGKRDITEQDFMSVPLENMKLENNTSTHYATKEVQDMLDPERGIYQAHKSTKEISSHTDNGCNNLTLDEADGAENTGHQHTEKEPNADYYLTIASHILNKNPELEEFYSLQGLAIDLQKYLNEHPDKTVEDFTEDRVSSCDHYPSYDKS